MRAGFNAEYQAFVFENGQRWSKSRGHRERERTEVEESVRGELLYIGRRETEGRWRGGEGSERRKTGR